MPVAIATGLEQNPLTVNLLLKNPLVVPELFRNMFMGQFVADQILRPAGEASGGAVQYWVAGPVFPDTSGGDVEVVAPLAEIPVADPLIGTPASVRVLKRGLGLRVSRELADRNNIGAVLRGIQQIKNAMVRSVDGSLITAFKGAVTQTVAAGAAWSGSTGTSIRKDIQTAIMVLAALQDAGYDYVPDTMLVSRQTLLNLKVSPEFLAPFVGAAAQQSPQLTGVLPGDNSSQFAGATYGGEIFGMKVLVSSVMPSNTVYILASKVVGGIADERGSAGNPIEISDMFAEPAHEAQRWNVTRATAGFIDNPGAVVAITGT